MAYKKKTTHYGIPYITDGEAMDGSEEQKITQMIDNLLFAGNMGLAKALFDDGNYYMIKSGERTYSLVISCGASYSAIGVLNYRLFCTNKDIVFTDISPGSIYYIYLGYTLDLDMNEDKFVKIASRNKFSKEDTTKLLMATVDFTGAEPIINENPDGKVYSDQIISHAANSTNPHGDQLFQRELKITEKLLLKDTEVFRTIYFTDVFPGVGTILTKTFASNVVFVNIMPVELGYGEFAVQIKDNVVSISNTQASTSFKAEVRIQ